MEGDSRDWLQRGFTWGAGGRWGCKTAPGPSTEHHTVSTPPTTRIFTSGSDPASRTCSTGLGEEEGTLPKCNPHPGE